VLLYSNFILTLLLIINKKYNSMKKITFLFVFAVIASLVFSGCDKYDEGPTLTLKSNVSRITGEWKPTKYTKNGVDQSFDPNYRVKFSKDGTLAITFTNNSVSYTSTGTWAFSNDDETLTYTSTFAGFSSIEQYTIKRLSSSQLFIEKQDDTNLLRYEYEKL
jgi:cytoskeletal protein RodZ